MRYNVKDPKIMYNNEYHTNLFLESIPRKPYMKYNTIYDFSLGE